MLKSNFLTIKFYRTALIHMFCDNILIHCPNIKTLKCNVSEKRLNGTVCMHTQPIDFQRTRKNKVSVAFRTCLMPWLDFIAIYQNVFSLTIKIFWYRLITLARIFFILSSNLRIDIISYVNSVIMKRPYQFVQYKDSLISVICANCKCTPTNFKWCCRQAVSVHTPISALQKFYTNLRRRPTMVMWLTGV